MKILRRKTVTGLLVALALVAASCGGDDATDTTVDAPLATTTEAPATTAAPTTTLAPVVTFDLVAAVGDYAAALPEDWMLVGDEAAFKEAVAASNGVVIDVRETGEYAEGHIMDAINIPLRTLGENLDKIPADMQVFVYCKSGWRAGLAVSSLAMLGYDNVQAYRPGWNGWTAAGEAISTGEVTASTFEIPEIEPELYAAVNDFLTTIPEGWLSAGDVESVKSAIEAGSAVIDIRTPSEYAEGFIAPATNVSLREIADHLGDIPTDTQAIAYCKSGWRAALSVPIFHVLGFDNVRAFPGSYLAWTGAGEPIETQ